MESLEKRDKFLEKYSLSRLRQEETEKMNEMKSWYFEKINKTDKPLAILSKKKKREDSNQ